MDREFDYVGFDFSKMEDLRSHNRDEEDFRQNILELVREGAITPEDAEERAFDRGLDSLISADWKGPSVLEFRAWSIEMTLAWLVWRSTRAAQDFYTLYRTQCFQWKRVRNGETRSGYERVSLKAASLGDVRAKASHSKKLLSYNDALKALWDRLEKGLVSGSALTVNGDEYKTIDAEEWATLRLNISDQGEACLASVFSDNVIRYHGVTFRTDDIFREWAPDEAQEVPEPENLALNPPLENPAEAIGAQGGDEAVHVEPANQGRGAGRRPDWAWDTAIRNEAMRLLDYHGDFNPELDPDWRRARLIDALLVFCQRTWSAEPSRSSMTNYTNQYLEAFRQQRAAD